MELRVYMHRALNSANKIKDMNTDRCIHLAYFLHAISRDIYRSPVLCIKVLFPASFNGELYAAMSTDTLRHACVCGLKGSKPQERNVSDYEEHLPELAHYSNRLGVPNNCVEIPARVPRANVSFSPRNSNLPTE